MNVQIPPAQDSPKHILNALNDDCIQLILRQLKNVLDFLSAAETCVRLQENAKLIFRTQFKQIRIDDFSRLSNTVTVDRVASFLNIFGHLITGIDFDRQAMGKKLGKNIQNMIAEYCGKTLKIFKIRSDNKVVDLNTRSPFESLEELHLDCTNIQNFVHQTQLKSLYVSEFRTNRTNFDWLIQAFPKLKIVTFWSLHRLQHNQLIGFLESNPQLQSLNVEFCYDVWSQFIEHIDKFTPNLEKLCFWYNSNHSLNAISNLRNLKFLSISSSREFPINELIDSLNENMVQIETLILGHAKFISDSKISQLKSLKKLSLTIFKSETLVHLVQNLPQLQKIAIKVCTTTINLNDIKEALQYGEHLSLLMVETEETKIDFIEYTSILTLAKLACAKVMIHTRQRYTIINIRRDLFEPNRKWLDIDLGSIPLTIWKDENPEYAAV